MFNRTFINLNYSGLAEIKDNQLKFTTLETVGGPAFIARMDITDSRQYQLSYDIKFEQGFDLSHGGKASFGFVIGEGASGGDNIGATIENKGGTFRVMWSEDNPNRTNWSFYPYVYYKDMKGVAGSDFWGKRYPMVAGVTYTIRLTIKVNTGAEKWDGYAKMEVKKTTDANFKVVWEKTDMRWTGNADPSQQKVTNITLDFFRGGGDSTWDGSQGTQYIFIDNVKWTNDF